MNRHPTIPPAGPSPSCRWCGEAVGEQEVAHTDCVKGFLGRLNATRDVRSGGPERLGDFMDRVARGDR